MSLLLQPEDGSVHSPCLLVQMAWLDKKLSELAQGPQLFRLRSCIAMYLEGHSHKASQWTKKKQQKKQEQWPETFREELRNI